VEVSKETQKAYSVESRTALRTQNGGELWQATQKISQQLCYCSWLTV